MKRNMNIAALAVPMTAELSSANAESRKAEMPKSQYHVFSVAGFETIPITACSRNPGSPVTMQIGSLLKELKDAGKINRAIKRRLANGTEMDVGRPAGAAANWPTNLDMELAEPAAGGGTVPNDYVMVMVVLKVVRGINFLRPPGAGATDSTQAVTVDPGTKEGFCGRTDVVRFTSGGATYQSVSFGVLKSADMRSINIGIMIPDNVASPTYWLPIILDLNVRNSG